MAIDDTYKLTDSNEDPVSLNDILNLLICVGRGWVSAHEKKILRTFTCNKQETFFP